MLLIFDDITDEEFLNMTPEEKVDMVCYYIGQEYNKLMEDSLNMAEETQSASFAKRLVDSLYEEFVLTVRETVTAFNQVCKDVMITDIRFGEIVPEESRCEIIPTYILK